MLKEILENNLQCNCNLRYCYFWVILLSIQKAWISHNMEFTLHYFPPTNNAMRKYFSLAVYHCHIIIRWKHSLYKNKTTVASPVLNFKTWSMRQSLKGYSDSFGITCNMCTVKWWSWKLGLLLLFFFYTVSIFNTLKDLTHLVYAGLFWCFHNSLNSDLDYRIFNVHMIFLHACIIIIIHRFYIALLSALEQTHCAYVMLHVILN